MKVLKFKTKLDLLLPIHEKKLLDYNEESKVIEKWFRLLEDDINEFMKCFEKKKLHQLDIPTKEIWDFMLLFNNWLVYVYNILCQISEDQFHLDTELSRFLSWGIPIFIQQILEIIIIRLSDFKSFSMGKYYQQYIDDSLNQISKEIIENKTDLQILAGEFQKLPLTKETLKTIVKKVNRRLSKIQTLFESLLDLENIKTDSTKLNELLSEFKLLNASDRLKEAYKFYNDEIWDKSVGDMRLVLEMVVTYIVRCVLGNPNWKAPLKDGIEVLLNKGIILDEVTANHFRAKKIGVHGIISIKGHHAEGITDDNLASSELEAKYFMKLTTNVIEYLLTSFRGSEFYNEEDENSS